MANDVTIVVEASLGDSLVKLALAEHAVSDLGASGDSASHSLRDFNASMDDATIASHKAGAAIHDTERLIRDAEAAITGGGAGGGGLSGAFSTLAASMGPTVPLLFGLTVPLIALPALAVAAAVAIVALADAIGTLVAITADFVAPASLIVGLLGSLGLGFFLAAKRAADGGGALQVFADKVATLKSMFHETTDILAHAFLPLLLRLADGAKQALLFIDKLAREPLAKAMRDMATQGIQMLNKFVEQVAHVVAKPIRLAFQIAFGSGKGGNEFAQAVATWWHQLSDFLFGYSTKHPIKVGGKIIDLKPYQVDGIFQPLIDWFNRHHFTKQGIQIGHAILRGFMDSGAAHRMGQFLIQVLLDAMKTVVVGGVRLWVAMIGKIGDLVHKLADLIVTALGKAWDWIKKVAGEAIQSIVDHFGNVKTAINTIKSLANDFWGILQKIAGFFSHPFTFSVNWPSPPAWLSSIVGGITGVASGSTSTAGRTGQGGKPPASSANVAAMSGVVVNHFHFHGLVVTDRAELERAGHVLGGVIGRQQARLADGH